jgi:hypothetical protein
MVVVITVHQVLWMIMQFDFYLLVEKQWNKLQVTNYLVTTLVLKALKMALLLN